MEPKTDVLAGKSLEEIGEIFGDIQVVRDPHMKMPLNEKATSSSLDGSASKTEVAGV